jgi:hypothetical protein
MSLDTCKFFDYACTIYIDAGSEQKVLEMEDTGGDLSYVHKIVIMDRFLP